MLFNLFKYIIIGIVIYFIGKNVINSSFDLGLIIFLTVVSCVILDYYVPSYGSVVPHNADDYGKYGIEAFDDFEFEYKDKDEGEYKDKDEGDYEEGFNGLASNSKSSTSASTSTLPSPQNTENICVAHQPSGLNATTSAVVCSFAPDVTQYQKETYVCQNQNNKCIPVKACSVSNDNSCTMNITDKNKKCVPITQCKLVHNDKEIKNIESITNNIGKELKKETFSF